MVRECVVHRDGLDGRDVECLVGCMEGGIQQRHTLQSDTPLDWEQASSFIAGTAVTAGRAIDQKAI